MTTAGEGQVEFVADHAPDPETSYVEIRSLYGLVHELPSPMRKAVVAVDIMGLSYSQAARALGVRTETIMTRLTTPVARLASLSRVEAPLPSARPRWIPRRDERRPSGSPVSTEERPLQPGRLMPSTAHDARLSLARASTRAGADRKAWSMASE
jgi:hypothetical protein